MANPQKEDGFTPIANEIMEALMRSRLPGREMAVALFVLRNSYGFKRKYCSASFGEIGKACGMFRQNVSKVMSRLIDWNVMSVISQDDRSKKTYGFNKDYDSWEIQSVILQGDRFKKPHGNNNKKSKCPTANSTKCPVILQDDRSVILQDDRCATPTILGKKERKEHIRCNTPAPPPADTPAPPHEKQKKTKRNPKTFSEDSNAYRLAKYLQGHILKNNPKALAKKANLQTWASDADKLLRIDQIPVEDIKLVIRFCQQDEFEMSNVLSVRKLRQRWDGLFLKAQRWAGHTNGNNAELYEVAARVLFHDGRDRCLTFCNENNLQVERVDGWNTQPSEAPSTTCLASSM